MKRKCAVKELESWQAAEESLKAVLAADAVPTKPLEEFIAACTGHTEQPGKWAAFIEWLASPRRAVAATVAGSFALTTLLFMLIWYGSSVLPSSKTSQPTFQLEQYNLAGLSMYSIGEEFVDNGI